MNNKYDIIVIGAGHNGLTTACRLAQAGKKIAIFEKNESVGGLAASQEFVTNYKTIGTLHDSSTVRIKIIEKLKLKSFGLNFKQKKPPITFLGINGESLKLDADINQATAEISKFSANDAEAYLKYQQFIAKIRPFILSLFDEIPPDMIKLELKQLYTLAKKGIALRRLGKKTMLEFLKVAPMSVADYLNETFETDFIKAALSIPSIHASYNGPWSSYTTLNLLLWECTANLEIKGSSAALVDSLEKAARNCGIDIFLNSPVKEILIDNNSTRGVELYNGQQYLAPIISASCHVKETFLKLIPAHKLEYSLEHGILNFRSRGTTAKLNIALNTIPALSSPNNNNIQYFKAAYSFDIMEKAFDPIKYNEISSEPILDICIAFGENVAPEGHSVISILVHFVPYEPANSWTDKNKTNLTNDVISVLERHIHNIKSHIVHKELLTPLDLQDQFNLFEGNLLHGEHAVDQLITRPIPSCARYETPISGLYLSGSSSHPGGGITCLPGFLSAERILKN